MHSFCLIVEMIFSILTSNKAVFWEIKLWVFKKKKSNHLLPCGVAHSS